jgi:hypothetical protein
VALADVDQQPLGLQAADRLDGLGVVVREITPGALHDALVGGSLSVTFALATDEEPEHLALTGRQILRLRR